MAMKVELFVPPELPYSSLNLDLLGELTGRHFLYASKGRHAIGHIIEALQPKNKIVLVSPYMCDSVFRKLDQMGMEIEYYDIDPQDLNPSPPSIENRIVETGAGTVIAASLYGNPADMEDIERICREHKVFLIDDAAQSFGAMLNGKYIGCFGDAGLYAFSPGKATAGHMGALFWTNGSQDFKRTHHYLAHKTAWLDFKYNRLWVYKSGRRQKKLYSLLNQVMQKAVNIENDDIEEFETEILGGILQAQLNGSLDYRNTIFAEFLDKYSENGHFRIVERLRGTGRPHKIVLVFRESKECDGLKKLLGERQIAYFSGYDISSAKFDSFKGCTTVRNCIVELPIEENASHMNYIRETLDLWLNRN